MIFAVECFKYCLIRLKSDRRLNFRARFACRMWFRLTRGASCAFSHQGTQLESAPWADWVVSGWLQAENEPSSRRSSAMPESLIKT